MNYTAVQIQDESGRPAWHALHRKGELGSLRTVRHCNALPISFPSHAIAFDRACEAWEASCAKWRG
jgi:hypothetical protein